MKDKKHTWTVYTGRSSQPHEFDDLDQAKAEAQAANYAAIFEKVGGYEFLRYTKAPGEPLLKV